MRLQPFDEAGARGDADDRDEHVEADRIHEPDGRTRNTAEDGTHRAKPAEDQARDQGAACDELSHLHWVPLTEARALDLPFVTEVALSELAHLLKAAGDGPLLSPSGVPFFDNRPSVPRFIRIG